MSLLYISLFSISNHGIQSIDMLAYITQTVVGIVYSVYRYPESVFLYYSKFTAIDMLCSDGMSILSGSNELVPSMPYFLCHYYCTPVKTLSMP